MKITETSSKWDRTEYDIENLFNISQCIGHSSKSSQTINHKYWKTNDKEDKEFIRKSDQEWYEKNNGVIRYYLKFESENDDEVILFAEDRKFYLKLDSVGLKWGYSIYDINFEINHGEWITTNETNNNI